ncbi:MAG: hypothetical protein ABFD83_13875 [Armatimonadota bacterium]
MTKKDLAKLVRSHLDELSGTWLKDTSSDPLGSFSIYDYLDLAYKQYAKETECFKVNYTKAAVVGTDIYKNSDFGTSGAGGRIFNLIYVAFNSVTIYPVTESRLDAYNSNWRFAANGTPTNWLKYSNKSFRLFPKPSAASDIYIEGYETPDISSFTEDTEPDIEELDHSLLAVYASILVTVRDPSNTNAIRASQLYPIWQAGIADARDRIHGPGSADVEVAREAGTQRAMPVAAQTITQAGG